MPYNISLTTRSLNISLINIFVIFCLSSDVSASELKKNNFSSAPSTQISHLDIFSDCSPIDKFAVLYNHSSSHKPDITTKEHINVYKKMHSTDKLYYIKLADLGEKITIILSQMPCMETASPKTLGYCEGVLFYSESKALIKSYKIIYARKFFQRRIPRAILDSKNRFVETNNTNNIVYYSRWRVLRNNKFEYITIYGIGLQKKSGYSIVAPKIKIDTNYEFPAHRYLNQEISCPD